MLACCGALPRSDSSLSSAPGSTPRFIAAKSCSGRVGARRAPEFSLQGPIEIGALRAMKRVGSLKNKEHRAEFNPSVHVQWNEKRGYSVQCSTEVRAG